MQVFDIDALVLGNDAMHLLVHPVGSTDFDAFVDLRDLEAGFGPILTAALFA